MPRTVRAGVRAAGRAPSVHNTQPWRWVFDGTRLHLFRDDSRWLAATDPHARQLVISCGAALHHARTAFADAGWHTDTSRLPDPARPDHLAAITFRPWPDPPPGIADRATAIDRRRTDRLPLLPPPRQADLVHRARLLVQPHDLELHLLGEDARDRLAEVSAHDTAAHRYDMAYQSELHWWTGHSAEAGGVPAQSLASAEEFARVGVGRALPSRASSTRRADLADRSSLLVISSPADAPETWLRTGDALSAVLLECTAQGLAICPLTHITEPPTGRRTIAELLHHTTVPQIVLRVGVSPLTAPPPPRTPRRPVEEILEIRTG